MTRLPQATLLPAHERKVRSDENRRKLLRFLRQEIWSTSDILRLVLKIESRQGIAKSLQKFALEGLIISHSIPIVNGQKITLWGITAHGQAMAFDPATESVISTYFEPSKVADSTLRHTLDIQRVRVRSEQQGWRNWINGDRLSKLLSGGRRPDALAISPQGNLTAIEVERTIKTLKRYEVILASYLRSIKLGEIGLVIWLCPSHDLSVRLQSILFGIKSVMVSGQRVQIDPERHHLALRIMDYSHFEHVAQNF